MGGGVATGWHSLPHGDGDSAEEVLGGGGVVVRCFIVSKINAVSI